MRTYVAAFLFVTGFVFSASVVMPAQPDSPKLWGIAYGPFRDGQSPIGDYPSKKEIAADMKLLKAFTFRVRTYSVNDTQRLIPGLARQKRIACSAGAHIGSDSDANDIEIERLIETCDVARCAQLVVGNEVLYHQSLSLGELITLIRRVKNDERVIRRGIPVGYAAAYQTFLGHPDFADLVAELDFLLIHIHPYWAGVQVEDAAEYVYEKWMDVKAAYPDDEIIIGETGWPSAGEAFEDAVPGETNQQLFLKEFVQLALEKNIPYFFFEAFDEMWKADLSGVEAEGHWGLWHSDRTMKPRRFLETPPPLIEILRAASCGVGGDRLENLAGRVHGITSAERSSYRVVIYAETNQWYVQPYANDPLTPISGNLSWSRKTHLGYSYAALLVRSGYDPPSTLSALPGPNDDVLAAAVQDCR